MVPISLNYFLHNFLIPFRNRLKSFFRFLRQKFLIGQKTVSIKKDKQFLIYPFFTWITLAPIELAKVNTICPSFFS
jgi:hypothetical protein